MATRHPFNWLSTSGQKRTFIVLLALTLAVMVSLNALGGPLNTGVAPLGIVSFELAGELSLAQSMVDSWGQAGQVYAGLNLGLDYVFLIAYSSSIALGCVLLARSLSRRVAFLSFAGVILAWAQFGAALLDAVENYALIRVLLGSQQASWPAVARWCAIPKFLIVAAGLVYVGVGAVLAVVTKGRTK
ncbi:MAG: hypothetical protein ACE5I2_01990 [Anaerolineae bacterium]